MSTEIQSKEISNNDGYRRIHWHMYCFKAAYWYMSMGVKAIIYLLTSYMYFQKNGVNTFSMHTSYALKYIYSCLQGIMVDCKKHSS
jgi:hypothetical protein